MNDLLQKKCEACELGTLPMTIAEYSPFMTQVEGWEVVEEKNLHRQFIFRNFRDALDFVNRIGQLAENEGHHPDIHLTNYKRVSIDLSTHSVRGLSENDFIMAAKINNLTKK